jgi:DNA-binding CsgD family transcriptional regulator
MRGVVVGRTEELGLIESFLARAGREPAVLLLCGEPGIGKTILWEAAVDRARERGDCVLLSRGAEAEATLSFVALSDLLSEVLEEALPSIPLPRRRALEVALLLEERASGALDSRAVAVAFLDVVRALAQSRPVVVALDDLQWLDAASAGVLQFALRRLRDERVGFLATVRIAAGATGPLGLSRWVPEDAIRVSLGALSLGVLYRLLKDRLGLQLARPELVRVHEVTGGNPFFALELGRELDRAKAKIAPGRPLPVPSALKELVGARLARLPAETREVLLTAAAMSRPSAELLVAAHVEREPTLGALEEAARAGVVDLQESGVRFVHPLLASVCYQDAPPWRRRAAHGRIAAATTDVEERARHLALACDRPDVAVASVLDAAAERSAARGATASASELCELAIDLTPTRSVEQRQQRGLRAAHFHRLAGDRERSGRILVELLAQVPRGPQRADVLLELAAGRQGDLPTIAKLGEAALDEASGDDVRCAQIMAFLSWIRLLEGNVRGALNHARAGLEKAERVKDPMLLARGIARAAMAETWALDITPGLVERGVAIEEALAQPLEFHESPKIALARRMICMGDSAAARAILKRGESDAAARGDEGTRGHLLFHLIVLEVFAGHFRRALSYVGEALDLAEQLGDTQYLGMALYASAWVEAHLGRVEPARAAAERAAAIAEGVSDAIFPIWIAAALGQLELSLGDLNAAERYLRPLPARLTTLGWNDPADEVWPDAIETLAGLGELDQARSYLEQYDVLAERSGSPWALTVAARCRGILSASEGELDAAFAAFERALAEGERVESRFERGRALLALGSVRRRAKQKRGAREALEQALEIFDRAGAGLWAERARDELARISGRRAASEQLTETEQRVSSLAARGLSNKEIAATLFMSVHTVEAHLSRIYRKVGVRSRAELAGRLAASDSGDAAAKV